jgi:hypothetical protein
MKIISATERLAEARGVKIGPAGVGNAMRKRKPLPGRYSR